jgi:uncharacterized membrane protein
MSAFSKARGRCGSFAILLGCTAAAVCPARARAELRFCNHTGTKVDVVIAYADKDAPGTTTNGDGGVTAEGWFSFVPGECSVVSDIHVGNHWTYFYAKGGGRVWQGSAVLCIPSRGFTEGVRFMRQGEACRTGYTLRGFRRMDATTKGFTMSLDQ